LKDISHSNLKPDGWIEQLEADVRVMSDYGSLSELSEDSFITGWGANFLGCAERTGHPIDLQLTMTQKIEKAEFVDVQEKLYKFPIGSWPKDKVLKDAGPANKEYWISGLDG
jgi:hypothetical protein